MFSLCLDWVEGTKLSVKETLALHIDIATCQIQRRRKGVVEADACTTRIKQTPSLAQLFLSLESCHPSSAIHLAPECACAERCLMSSLLSLGRRSLLGGTLSDELLVLLDLDFLDFGLSADERAEVSSSL